MVFISQDQSSQIFPTYFISKGQLQLTLHANRHKRTHVSEAHVSEAFQIYNKEANNNAVVCNPEPGKTSSEIPT